MTLVGVNRYAWTFVPDKIPVMTPALVFGVFFDLLLFGILTAQAYIYYLSFPKDRVILKVAVIWVYLAGIAQTGLASVDLCGSFIASTMGPDPLTEPDYWLVVTLGSDHLWLSITASSAAVAVVIQSLYAQRIYLISKKLWLAAIIICLSLGQFASGIIGAICYSDSLAISGTTFLSLELGVDGDSTCYYGFTWIWGPINITCDLTITICMVTFIQKLLKQRKRTMIHQTRSHITRIVQIVVETGMATTALMTIYTILFSLWNFDTNTSTSYAPFFPLPGLMMSKVYSNSMLALLNNRAIIANGRNSVEPFEFVEVSGRSVEGDIQLQTRNQIFRASMGSQNDGT